MKNFTKISLVLSFLFLFGIKPNAQTAGTALAYSTNDYLQLPNNLLNTVTGDFTIETWVYWTGPTGNNFQRIFDFGKGTNEYMYLTPSGKETMTNTDRLIFGITIFGNCCEQRLTAPAELTPNTWHHIAVTLNNAANTGTLFLDGTIVATNSSMTYDVSNVQPTTQNWLGRSQYPTDPYFNGTIDEFRISNNIRYTANFTPQPIQFTTDANTVALYHFNEGSGQTTNDESANNLDGILGGTIAVEASDPTWVMNSILPVRLISFEGKKGSNSVTLNWQASSTNGSGEFIIERSADGVNFYRLGAVTIAANGTDNFSFTDRDYLTSKNYYRLKIAEINAAVKYSSVVVIDMSGKAAYSAYPTKTSSQIFIKVPKASTAFIYNNSGLLVKKVELPTSQNVDVTNLSIGIYQIRFEGSGETLRFIKM